MASVVSLGLLGRRLGGLLSSCSWPPVSSVCSALRKLSLDNTSSTPPKRPLNAYLRYVVEQQQVLFKQNPDVKVAEKTKWIAQAWRQLTPDQKQPYELAATDARLKYKVELAAFKAKLTPAQLASLKEERRQKLAKRRTIRKKRKLTILGKPKLPRTAFNIFMAENFDEAKGATSQTFSTLKTSLLNNDLQISPNFTLSDLGINSTIFCALHFIQRDFFLPILMFDQST
ncbi:transcription factor A, mitochondrial isoform X2 [Cetorhinus maximus]